MSKQPVPEDWKKKTTLRLTELRSLCRKTVTQTWLVGEGLSKVKESLPHGEFQEWVEAHNLKSRTARRYMEVSHVEPEAPQLTAADKRKLEPDALARQAREAEAEKAEAQQQLKEAKEKIKHLQQGEKVAEGHKQSVSVIEERQAEVRQIKAKLADSETREKELRSENARLRKQIETLKEGEI